MMRMDSEVDAEMGWKEGPSAMRAPTLGSEGRAKIHCTRQERGTVASTVTESSC